MPENNMVNKENPNKKRSLRDSAKQLAADATRVLGDTVRLHNDADALMKRLRNVENSFIRAREEQEKQARMEEKLRALNSHSKAYTSESGFVMDNVVKEETPAPQEKPAVSEEVAEERRSPVKEAEPAAVREPVAAPQEPAPAPREPAAAAPQEPAAAPEKKPEAPAKPSAAKAQEAPQEQPARERKPQAEKRPERKPAEQPARPAKPAEKPARPMIGQIISRPGDEVVKKPVGPAPNVLRMSKVPVQPQQGQQRGFAPRPQGQGGFNRAGGPQGGARPQGQGFQRQGAPAQSARGAAPGGARPAQGGFGRPAGGGRPRMVDMPPATEKERVSNYDPNKKQYQRQQDPERVARNRKQLARDAGYGSGMDDEVIRGGKRSRVRKPSVQQTMAPIKIETAYMSGDTITVRDLTERIGKTAGEIIKKLFVLGNMATINSEIDFDTASLVASEFGVTLEKKADKTAEDALSELTVEDSETDLRPRPPVVTIMGHVDHGKTSLLDYIRSSRVTAGEAGGITQHIGAYTVKLDGRQITFLDTPGHEAFTAMRMRGAQATDIAVLVVAADDSVMPQTVEAINHAKAADVPIIVAINKMDKPQADPERVKQDLTKYGVVCEEWGGDAICVPVSAKTGAGVDELLEMILLQADTMELKANPNRLGRGVIIEAKLDKARGPLATVLLQNGTLHVGDNIIAGMASGRVRALINDRGEKVKEAGPSMPVEIMGFDDVPSAGDEMFAVGDDKLSRQVADERREKLRASREATAAKVSMENLFSSLEEGKTVTLNLIIKADVQGSVEAVKQAMEKLSNDEVKVRVLHSGAGAVTKDDINLASAFNAIVIGFNIRPDASAREAAEKEKVDVRLYTVIYKAIEDMELAMKGLLAPEYREVLLGHAEVRNVFKITGAGIIAGCYVTDGKVQRNASVRLLRDNVVVHEGKLSSLRHLKDDVKEMAAGYECGMSLEGHNDIKEGDVVECFIMEEIPR